MAEVVKKKVKPYPFDGVLTGQAVMPCKVLKLTLRGLLVDTGGAQLHIHDKLKVAFEIPHYKDRIESEVVVVKFYDKFSGSIENKKIERWDELHFIKLTTDFKLKIERFLKAIKQVEKY